MFDNYAFMIIATPPRTNLGSTHKALDLSLPSLFISLHAIELVYPQTSNIRCTLVGNKIVDHSDVVGASPVGAAPTTSSFSD